MDSPPQKTWRDRRNYPFYAGTLAGIFYGIVAQFFIRLQMFDTLFGVMSFGYVFLLPFVLGILTVFFAPPSSQRSWVYRILMPWVTTGICLAASLIVGWEGTICFVMAAIIFLPLASIGGIITGIIVCSFPKNNGIHSFAVMLLMISPPLSAVIESKWQLPVQMHEVETQIPINTSAEIIWNQITVIPTITEPLSGFFYKMGFPKPVEATLSHSGVGGVRHAAFERGLVFIETINVWEPMKELSFHIRTDPASIPPTTLDPHVMVGGQYFDVLQGTYTIETLDDDSQILHLKSEFNLSTRFNFYSGLWARFLMRDIQQSILNVIKARCEGSSP